MKIKNLFYFLIPIFLLLSCGPVTNVPSPTKAVPTARIPVIQPTAVIPPTMAPTIPVVSTAAIVITDVTNTHWVGSSYDQDQPLIWAVFEIIFLPDGKLRYYTPNSWLENGTWKQNGDDITLEWANHACELYGVLYGDWITGAKQCTDGKVWAWSVQYQP